MELNHILPLVLVIFCNVCYHLLSKRLPTDSNPFLGLILTYGVACLTSLLLFAATKKAPLPQELSRLSLSYAIMGITVVGIEGGFLLMYRNGWELSKASLAANICLAVILFLIGAVFLKEGVSVRKLAGLAACAAGILLIGQ